MIEGRIHLTDLYFGYPIRPNEIVLKGIDINIPAGRTLLIMGGRGAGKSTLLSLIQGFYEPSCGSIVTLFFSRIFIESFFRKSMAKIYVKFHWSLFENKFRSLNRRAFNFLFVFWMFSFRIRFYSRTWALRATLRWVRTRRQWIWVEWLRRLVLQTARIWLLRCH